jgi:hypothetical protein
MITTWNFRNSITPSAYLERLIELDVGGGAVEEALLDAIDEPAEE